MQTYFENRKKNKRNIEYRYILQAFTKIDKQYIKDRDRETNRRVGR